MSVIEAISGFHDWNWSAATVFRYFGYVPVILIALVLQTSSQDPASSKIRETVSNILGASALLWFFAVIVHWLLAAISLYCAGFGQWLFNLTSSHPSMGAPVAWYLRLDLLLSPATGNMLLAAALFILAIARDDIKPKWLRTAKNTALVALALVANSLIVMRVVEEPFLILPMLGFFAGAQTSFNSQSNIVSLFQSTVHRGNKVKNAIRSVNVWDLPARFAFFWLILAAFWYPVRFSADVQIAFYSAAIGGLMAVIGFAALVFTFTYEQITLMRLRRLLAKITGEFQSAGLGLWASADRRRPLSTALRHGFLSGCPHRARGVCVFGPPVVNDAHS